MDDVKGVVTGAVYRTVHVTVSSAVRRRVFGEVFCHTHDAVYRTADVTVRDAVRDAITEETDVPE